MELSGIPEIDDQHTELLKLLKTVRMWYGTKSETASLFNAVANLVRYTKVHFEYEESLQKRAHYFEYESHKKEHEVLSKIVTGMYDDLLDDRVTVPMVLELIESWLTEHIDIEAKLFRKHIHLDTDSMA